MTKAFPCQIRPETAADYPAIAELHAAAFTYAMHAGEAWLTAALRQQAGYDPELALVAERDGEIVGHGLFTLHPFQVAGSTRIGAILAPLGVLPGHQGQGIGAALVREGHRRLLGKGVGFSVLLGHPAYYPRFGYRARMYGAARVLIPANSAVPTDAAGIAERRPVPADVPLLRAMWNRWYGGEPFTPVPGAGLADWVAPSPAVRSALLCDGGGVLGYVRHDAAPPYRMRLFLARDALAARNMLAHLAGARPEAFADGGLALPMPGSADPASLLDVPLPLEKDAWEAAMIAVLSPRETAVSAYCRAAAADGRRASALRWPIAFDCC